jgi:hypothetical protein
MEQVKGLFDGKLVVTNSVCSRLVTAAREACQTDWASMLRFSRPWFYYFVSVVLVVSITTGNSGQGACNF